MTNNKKSKQHNINIHKNCVDRIEEMYEENKKIYKLYQEFYTKYNVSKNDILKLENELKVINEELKNKKNNDINKYNESLISNYIKEKTIFTELEIITKNNYKKEEQSSRLINFDKYKEYKNNNNDIKKDKIIDEINKSPKNSKIIDNLNVKEHVKEHVKKDTNILQKSFNDPVFTVQETCSIKPKRYQKQRDKSLPILDRFNVKVFKNEDLKDSEILQFVGSEDSFIVEYQYKISEKLNKKIENITIDDVIDFKIKYEGYRNIRTRRMELRYLITRSKILFETYGKKLCNFKISLYHLKIMNDEEWNEWLKEFDKLFNEIINKEKICNHKYKNNKECGKLNCKIKHKDNI